MSEIKGYKATMPDGRSWYNSNAAPYVAGETYSYYGTLMPCKSGLHFCRRLENVYIAYLESYQTRVFEVTAFGRCLENGIKFCTDRLRIDRELSPKEILEGLFASGPDSCGHGVLLNIVWQTVHGVHNLMHASYDVKYDAAMFERMTERNLLFRDAAMELAAVDEHMSALLKAVETVVDRYQGGRR